MTVPLSDLWCRALADLERAETSLAIAVHADIRSGLEREITERKGICNLIDWIFNHQDLVADTMADERRKALKVHKNVGFKPNEDEAHG